MFFNHKLLPDVTNFLIHLRIYILRIYYVNTFCIHIKQCCCSRRCEIVMFLIHFMFNHEYNEPHLRDKVNLYDRKNAYVYFFSWIVIQTKQNHLTDFFYFIFIFVSLKAFLTKINS